MGPWRLSPEEKRKYDLAEKLGLLPRLIQEGWAGLPAKETGKIGGMLRGKGKS